MNYPSNIADVRAAIDSFDGSAIGGFAEAQEKPAPVDKIVGAYRALKAVFDAGELDAAGRALLCGCAAVITKGQFHGLGDEALTTHATVFQTLPAATPEV